MLYVFFLFIYRNLCNRNFKFCLENKKRLNIAIQVSIKNPVIGETYVPLEKRYAKKSVCR